MRCRSCGRERPRYGDCPHCGAPESASPGGSMSSSRNWRDQADNEDDFSDRGRSQFTNPPNQSYGRQSGTPSRPNYTDPRMYSPDGGQSTYSRTPSRPQRGDPNQSYARRGGGYDEYGLDERSLMVPQDNNNVPMLPTDHSMLPALPSEEEERMLGIRRPAFIPATEERKGPRPGRWRVISGTMSVMLLCVALCGITGFFAKQNVLPQINRLIGKNTPPTAMTSPIVVPTVFMNGKTLITPGPAAQPPSVGEIKSGKTLDNNNVSGESALYHVGDTLYLGIQFNKGFDPQATARVQWVYNNVDITKSLGSDCCSHLMNENNAGGETTEVEFKLVLADRGNGEARLFYNDQQFATVVFLVVPNATPTPMPTPTTAPNATPAPTPK
jgi:hypothetical protein